MSTTPPAVDRQEVLKRALLEIKQMRSRLESIERARTEPIAIIGMACRLPGADSPEALWQVLRDGRDCTRDIPSDRWDVEAWYDPDPEAPGRMYTRRGGFLSEVDRFDARFFDINPREAASLDPQHRLFWELAWEALERAGRAPRGLAGSRTGVFVGITNMDYGTLQALQREPSELDGYAASSALSFAAGRLSYMLGLQGPSLALDTACSSSAVAVHLACQSLRGGESDLAIVGGVNLILTPGGNIVLSKARMLSPDGRCKTFDASADGYGRGEGCGVVVLERLSDAVARGSPILALVRGSAVNQDGPSSGPTVPNGQAQQAVIREALERAGVKPSEVGYVEAHGTGTSLGDPIELRALGAVLAEGRAPERPCQVGSIKTNVGHLESASGIAGLLKVVLSLRHRQLPPHLHFRQPSPNIPWSELPLEVPTRLVPWEAERRIAGLSSFGASGTNAHLVLEEAPVLPEEPASGAERPVHVLTLSARREQALRELAARHEAFLAENPSIPLGDVAFTANTGRTHFSHRLAVVAGSASAAREKLAGFVAGETSVPGLVTGQVRGETRPRVAFLFTGQGSQSVGMGRELYATQPVFREVLDRCAALLGPRLERPLLEVLYPREAGKAGEWLDQTAFTQPALFSLEYALAELWRSFGVVPEAVLGHSVGELAAACVAGAMSLEEGLTLIAERGRLMQGLPRGGEMAAIFTDEATVAGALEAHAGTVSIAAVNGPSETVISGVGEHVAAVAEALRGRGIKSRRLQVSHAFHSPLMEPILGAFEQAASRVHYQPARIKQVSNLTGRFAQGAEGPDAAYWRRHVREPVRFADGIRFLRAQGIDVFLEVGPKPILLGMGRACLPEDAAAWLPSLREGQGDWAVILSSLAELHVRGSAVDWQAVERGFSRRRRVLPTHPFQRERHWFSASASTRPARLRGDARPTLFGERVVSPTVVAFESVLDASRWAILRDHRVFGRKVVSGVVHLALAAAAAAQVHGVEATRWVEDVRFQDMLLVEEGEPRLTQVVLGEPREGAVAFQFFSLEPGPEGRWKCHTTGRFQLGAQGPGPHVAQAPALAEIRARCTEVMSEDVFYARLWKDDEHHIGPTFRLVERVWRRDGEVLGQLRYPAADSEAARLLLTEACIAEACGQVVKAAFPGQGVEGSGQDVFIGRGVEQSRTVREAPPGTRYCHVRLRPGGGRDTGYAVDMTLMDEKGQVLTASEGMRMWPLNAQLVRRAVEGRPGGSRKAREPGLTRAQLWAAPAAERERLLRDYVVRHTALLAGVKPSEVDVEASLRELGLDSLQAVELEKGLETDLGLTVSVAELIEGPSPSRLARLLVGRLQAPEGVSAPEARARPVGGDMPRADDARVRQWIRRPVPPGADVRLRLFCFPFGGGGALTYRGWSKALPSWVEVCPVQLPGREDRLSEAPLDRMPAMLEALEPVVLPLLDKPFAFFGASMGGFIAFELARRLRAAHGLRPECLFIAASTAPQAINPVINEMFDAVAASGDASAEAVLRRFDLVPEVLLAHPEMVRALLPTLQADFRLVRGYEYRQQAPLECPLSVLGGVKDRFIGRAHLEGWREHTTQAFRLRVLPGEHLFIRTEQERLFEALREDLAAFIPARP